MNPHLDFRIKGWYDARLCGMKVLIYASMCRIKGTDGGLALIGSPSQSFMLASLSPENLPGHLLRLVIDMPAAGLTQVSQQAFVQHQGSIRG